MSKLRSIKQAGLVALLTCALAVPAWAGSSVHVGAGYGGGHYGGHYGGYYRGHGGYHGGDDAAVALFAGLLFGGLLGYAISEDRNYQRSHSSYYRAPTHTHYQQPVQQAVPVITHTTRAPAFAEPSGCLQTREYTTVLNIDGERKEAYGTRCLQANGTWVFGPPKIAPQFD